MQQLAVDAGGGTGAVGLLHGANPASKGVVDPIEGAVVSPLIEVPPDGALEREVDGQIPPLATGAEDLEDGVEYIPQIGLEGASTGGSRRKMRVGQDPLLVGDVAGVVVSSHPISTPSKTKSSPYGTVSEPEADEGELPDLKADYKAHANASNKPVYSLHRLLGKDGCRSFRQVALDSHSECRQEKEGQIIVLRFAGTKIWELTINGLNLWRLFDGIHRHVTPWIRKLDRGFAAEGDGEPLIQGIDIKEIEREG